MKINPIQIYYNHTNYNTPQKQVQQPNQHACNNLSNHNEIIGRSQVSFGSNNQDFKFHQFDSMFIDTTAQNLRLNNDEKNTFKAETTNFLQKNNLTSLDELYDDLEGQGAYLENIVKKLDLSDYDYNILADDFIERVECDGNYIPETKKYDKDWEVVDFILEKYTTESETRLDIFDIMKMEAESRDLNTLFDIFKPENNSPHSITLATLSSTFGENTATDIYIDFALAAAKDPKTRHSEIDKNIIQSRFYDYSSDYIITCDILDYFQLDDENGDAIEQEVQKRRTEKKNIHQIAFELADKYKLPSGAEEYISTSIINNDKILAEVKNKKTKTD